MREFTQSAKVNVFRFALFAGGSASYVEMMDFLRSGPASRSPQRQSARSAKPPLEPALVVYFFYLECLGSKCHSDARGHVVGFVVGTEKFTIVVGVYGNAVVQ
jgi:hypothetical protein